MTRIQVVPQDRAIERVRHQLRLRLLDVVEAERITRHVLRVTLSGAQLQGFVSLGFDDHVKLFLPVDGQIFASLPELGSNGPIFDLQRPAPVSRDYTPHTFDADRATMQLDFALHNAGPATLWARRAQFGDKVVIGGPRGSFIVGTGFDWHLLAGDETAIPAIRRRLAELPSGARAVVFIEIDGAKDQQRLETVASATIRWIHRGEQTLLQSIEDTALPDGDCYAWIACESSDAKLIRRHLIDRGLDLRFIKASGYWRRGADGIHDVHS